MYTKWRAVALREYGVPAKAGLPGKQKIKPAYGILRSVHRGFGEEHMYCGVYPMGRNRPPQILAILETAEKSSTLF